MGYFFPRELFCDQCTCLVFSARPPPPLFGLATNSFLVRRPPFVLRAAYAHTSLCSSPPVSNFGFVSFCIPPFVRLLTSLVVVVLLYQVERHRIWRWRVLLFVFPVHESFKSPFCFFFSFFFKILFHEPLIKGGRASPRLCFSPPQHWRIFPVPHAGSAFFLFSMAVDCSSGGQPLFGSPLFGSRCVSICLG